jgi:hypothetical protein
MFNFKGGLHMMKTFTTLEEAKANGFFMRNTRSTKLHERWRMDFLDYCKFNRLPFIEFQFKHKYAILNFYPMTMDEPAKNYHHDMAQTARLHILKALQDASKESGFVRVSHYDGYAEEIKVDCIDKVVRMIYYQLASKRIGGEHIGTD